MKNRRYLHALVLVAIAGATVGLASCVDDDEAPPQGGLDAGGLDAAGDVGADVTTESGTDAGIDSAAPDAASPDAPSDAAPDVDVADAAEAGPLFDDAGCPLPTGIVVSVGDSGIPATGLVMWLRADIGVATINGVSDGGTVCRWDDVSGSGHPVYPATATGPTKTDNGLDGAPAVSFPSTGRQLVTSGVLGIGATSGRTVAVYGKATDTTHRFQYFTQGVGSSAGTYFGLDQNTHMTAGSREGVEVTNCSYDTALATSATARTHILSISSFAVGTNIPGALTYAVDGVAQTFTRKGGTGNNTVEDFAGANFTQIGYGVPGFTGALLGEMLVYDRALTALERTAIEQYFAARF